MLTKSGKIKRRVRVNKDNLAAINWRNRPWLITYLAATDRAKISEQGRSPARLLWRITRFLYENEKIVFFINYFKRFIADSDRETEYKNFLLNLELC